MGLLDILSKGVKAMIDEATTPESFKIGEKFEDYVRGSLFIDKYYDVLERTHNYNENKDYIQSSLKPDFKFRDKLTKKEFYVEAKFRTSTYNGKIVWCDDKQLARYFECNKERPVFIILGMGEKSNHPNFLSLIPLPKAKYTGLFPPYAEQFKIELNKPVSSKILWAR